MKVAIIGASGFVGGAITSEALDRGHDVTGIARTPPVLPGRGAWHARSVDIADTPALAGAIRGHDAVIHAYSPGRGRTDPEVFDTFVAGHRRIIAAVNDSGCQRLLCVGGAGSLLTREGIPLLESSEWPADFDAYRDGVRATRELYYLLGDSEGIDWVYLSPSSILCPGVRTGAYRVGGDHLLYAEDGQSRISVEDYAVAMIDELERPKHHRARFTVGY